MKSSPLAVTFYCADQNPHRDRSLGITSYTRGLLTHLQEKPGISLSAVTSRSSFTLPAGVPEQKLPFRTDSMPGRLLADHLHPLFARSRGALWHYPKGFLPAMARTAAPTVCTVHDTILQHYADHYAQTRSRADFSYWIGLAKISISRADVLLTISESARAGIEAFCERHRLKLPPLYVTYQGVNLQRPPAERPKGDYVLHLASPLPHKRTRWLCDVWRELQRADRNLPKLLLVGSADEQTLAVVSQMSGVEMRGAVQRDELAMLLAQARALLLPSEIEGFGLPAVEAYAAGTPVAYVKGTAVEEVLGGGAAGGFHLDPESFRAALDDVLSIVPSAVEQKAAELAQRFSWEGVVERTVAAYRTVA